jgi:hypothetical protein
MLIKKINKLFYGKYPYKVSTFSKGASLLVHCGYDFVEKFCNDPKQTEARNYLWKRTRFSQEQKDDLKRYSNKVNKYVINEDQKDIKTRAEMSYVDFYTTDYALYQEIQAETKEWIREIAEPASQADLDFMKVNGTKKLLVDQLPHGKYEYKISLKTNISSDKRQTLINWLGRYKQEQIHVSKETSRWLRNERKWANEPFLYVNNGPMLSLVGMFLTGNIRKVDNYILRSSVAKE